jgi:plastocyanin
MSRAARGRVVLGVGIPVLALVFLGLLVFAFSRILLALPETAAPWVALLFATNILVGCALAAMIPGTRGFAFLISVLIATIVIGGIAGFAVGPREVHSLVEGEHASAEAPEENEPSASDEPVVPAEGESPAEEEPPADEGGSGDEPVSDAEPGEAVAIAAQGLAFDTQELSLPSGAPSVIAFDNQDAAPHNVSIYTEQGGDALFQGEVITGPDQIDYEVPPQEPGEYFFQCDVHPTTMTGTVTVG